MTATDLRTTQPWAQPRSDARLRLPREPYPGLRPFLDFEAPLFFGRERQVREVIERLRETRFVAVLGGSGSGKSSLIHAAVIPELRSFGIPGAGDLWLPMVCTPGTNVSAAAREARTHTPITRLARRFAALLKSRGSEAADAERLGQIADVFRQETGFARLFDVFAKEIAVPPGPSPDDAKVLFVLDQFEEIFHPTNQGVEDARLLVERVLDHFFDPHPRAFVVLTMRSEHLNDCAAYLELPDAINKCSYLVRRLGDDELQQAIVEPAQRFLRLMARSSEEPERLPQAVRFEPAVVERLVADTRAIAHDPDHLPLLQHLLARLWQAALEREEMDVNVPSHITEIDLVRAVDAGKTGDEQPLPPDLNTLRACVENWPQSIYAWHDEGQRAQLDIVFGQLGFKDPNTGLYSQQRIEVDAFAPLLGEGRTRDDLKRLLTEGFLGSVDYLFWDDEDDSRVTLKVSHESFIRGWPHFRALVDAESVLFDGYLNVLRRCAAWVAAGRSDDFLLEGGEMRRLLAAGFEARLASPKQRRAWSRLLKLTREAVPLAKVEAAVDAFFDTSRGRLRSLARRDARTRNTWFALAALLLLAVPLATYSLFIQGPVADRVALLFGAGNRANLANPASSYPGVGAALPVLEPLLDAAELVDRARSGEGSTMARWSQRLIDTFGFIGPVRSQDLFLKGVAAQAELPVSQKLRQVLAGAVWFSAGPAGHEEIEMPGYQPQARCSIPDTEATGVTEATGALIVAGASETAGATAPRRAIFLPEQEGLAKAAVLLRSAFVDGTTGACSAGGVVLSIPVFVNPYVVFDAGLRHLFVTSYGENVEAAAVTLHRIEWERTLPGGAAPRVRQSEVQAAIRAREAVGAVIRTAPQGVAVARTWREKGGWGVELAGARPWRLVWATASLLEIEPAAADDAKRWAALKPPATGSACARVPVPPAVAGTTHQMLEPPGAAGPSHCFLVTRAAPARPGDAAPVSVQVFDREVLAARGAADAVAPIAQLTPFARLWPDETEFVVGLRGEHAGWVALRQGPGRLVGAPWSTCALWRLAREIGDSQPQVPAMPGGSAPREACRDG
jgi:hypothetical protein